MKYNALIKSCFLFTCQKNVTITGLNPISQGVSISSNARGGRVSDTPLGNQGRSCFDPMLLYISCKYLEFELTCKKFGKNLKN